MKKVPKLIHFTHHTCVAHGLADQAVARNRKLHDEGIEHGVEEYQRIYGKSAPLDHMWGCRYASGASRPTMTTDIAEVTCPWCMAQHRNDSLEGLFERAATTGDDGLRRYYERRAENWADDRELSTRAWFVCCRHVGAPCPIPRRAAIKRLRIERARQVRTLIEGAVLGGAFAKVMLSSKRLTDAMAKLDPADRKLLRGTVPIARKADAMLQKALKLNESIDAIVRRAEKRIASSAVVELTPEAA